MEGTENTGPPRVALKQIIVTDDLFWCVWEGLVDDNRWEMGFKGTSTLLRFALNLLFFLVAAVVVVVIVWFDLVLEGHKWPC